MASEIAGFGGLFFEAGAPVAYLVDLNERERAEAALAPVLRARGMGGADIQFRQGRYDFLQLKQWSDSLPSVLGIPGVVFTDIDEAQNRLVIGIESVAVRERAETVLAQRNVPREAVAIQETESIRFMATLRDPVRPVRGGLQIAYSNYLCTAGFNATPAGTSDRTFLTNSHCSDVRNEADGTRYFQPNTSSGSYYIGYEYREPNFFVYGPCPSGRLCRYSDASLALYDPVVAWDFGYIARTAYRDRYSGSLTINDANPRFRIATKRYTAPEVGIELEKVGRTTGWTYGLLSRSCVNTNVKNTSITLLCQDFVDAGVGGGDSGSPVFYWYSKATDVTLFGVLWGGNDSVTQFVFSSMPNIEDELGGLSVFTSSSTGDPTEPPPPDECEDPTVLVC